MQSASTSVKKCQKMLNRFHWRRTINAGLFALWFASAGASDAQTQPSSLILTPEFYANWGLNAINAQGAYALGYNGAGIKLGIADDAFQLTHPEFIGRVYSPSLYPAFPVPGYDIPSHGTHVMGLAAAGKNDFGMMGVAYGASLAGVVAIETTGYPKPGDWEGELIRAGVTVMNGSFGPWARPRKLFDDETENPNYRIVNFQAITSSELVSYYESVKRLSAEDIVMVFAAGNEYRDQPNASRIPSGIPMIPLVTPANTAAQFLYRIVSEDSDGNNPNTWKFVSDPEIDKSDASEYRGALIAVVAVDKKNLIAGFSNRCGAAAAWCMAAPGVDLLSSVPMNTYGVKEGTSMAAPLVAGSAAVLRQAFPYMSARQIIEVLLTSSTSLGSPDIYGHGLLNLGRAVKGPVSFGSNEIFSSIFAVDTKGYSSTWSNDISGPGGLSKSGFGVLRLTGNNTYTGNTTLLGGILRVDGSITSSSVLIGRGATLSGVGYVGNTINYGTISPGNSVGTLTIVGDYRQMAGSNYLVDINDKGQADVLRVTGSAFIEDSAGITIVARDGLDLGYKYNIMYVSGTLTGSFKIETDFVFLDESVSTILNDQGAIDFSVTRNDVKMASFAQTNNQAAVAQAIDSQSTGHEPFDTLIAMSDASYLPEIYQNLSGEIYASNQAIIINSARLLNQAINTRIQDSWLPEGIANTQQQTTKLNDDTTAWAQFYGSRDRLGGNDNAKSVSANGVGLLFGLDHAVSPHLRLGGAFGFNDLSAKNQQSQAATQGYHLALYGTAELKPLRLSAGLTQSWYGVKTTRTLPYSLSADGPGVAKGDLPGSATQLFLDVGIPITLSAQNILQPFVNVSQTWLRMDSFAESGSVLALKGDASNTSTAFSTLGLRWQKGWQTQKTTWQVHAMTGWQRAWGNLAPSSSLSFDGGNAFTVYSAPLARNALALELGIGANLSTSSRLMLVYAGAFGSGTSAQTLQAQLRVTF